MNVFAHHLFCLLVVTCSVLSSTVAWAQDPLPDTPIPDNPAPFIIPGMPSPAPVPVPVPMPQPAPMPFPAPVAPQPFPAPSFPQPLPMNARPVAPVGAQRVFLASFQSYDPALNGEAARLTQVLQIHMLSRYNLATIDQVPPWPDYNALVYLMGCPVGQYAGCALVCGNRVQAEWTVGATVSRGLHGVNATLSFVENASAREVISFGVALHGTNDADLNRAVDTILVKLMNGAFAAVDLRRAEVDPVERAKLEAARNDVLAASLVELERNEGAVAREELQATEPEKIDKEALTKEYEEREEVKPWEAVNLSEGAYVRYKNSGLPLDTWRDLSQGRAGAIILRGALGGGSGPFGQYFDGRYAIDDDLERAEVEQFQFVSSASHANLDLEAGIGVLPFLDITAHYAYRNSQFTYLINQERIDAPVIVDAPVRNAYATWQVGGRINLVPFPIKSVRPMATVGVAYWKGSSWDLLLPAVQDLEPMKPMNQVLVQLGPGVEVTAGKRINLFARALIDMSVAGQTVERFNEGGASLIERADPTEFKNSNAGLTIQGGVTMRLRLFSNKERAPENAPSDRFEDEGNL